ncbi:MAG TPA: hypothetical protein VIK33_04565 [Anaerolineae bacterium]
MQSGQQFKVDQPGLMKAGLIPVIVGAVAGALYIIQDLSIWSLAGLLGWLVPIFGGVWYVMTARKSGAMPAQMDGLVNGAIMGAVVGVVFGIVAWIVGTISATGIGAALLGLGFGNVIARLIGGAVGGAVGAFGYSYLVSSGQIK